MHVQKAYCNSKSEFPKLDRTNSPKTRQFSIYKGFRTTRIYFASGLTQLSQAMARLHRAVRLNNYAINIGTAGR
ncbi:hypothetical protein, partial [Nostoc sp.]|uniref:hypothetical protein n=1 Tax=Nostoc sp. TaxID=1180 RepID=UPI002FF573BC